MNIDQFSVSVKQLIVAAARKDGVSDEAIIAELRTIAETLEHDCGN